MSIISEKIKGDFVHIVFFWLKNPNNQNDRKIFKKLSEEFIDKNPQVVSSHIGEPANTKRNVIDSSYTNGLILTFPDLETQDAYQVDPTHLLVIEKA